MTNKGLDRFQGTQHKHVFPIHRDLVVRMKLYAPEEHKGCVYMEGRIADVGLAGRLSTSSEMRFAASVILSDSTTDTCGQMNGTMGSPATGGQNMMRKRDKLSLHAELL